MPINALGMHIRMCLLGRCESLRIELRVLDLLQFVGGAVADHLRSSILQEMHHTMAKVSQK